MNDMSRRSFLKGVMASAAIVAVAPTFAVPASEATQHLHLLVEPSDLWLKPDDQWRFIGKLLSATIRPEERRVPEIQIPVDRDLPEWMLGMDDLRQVLGGLVLCVDDEGRRFLDEAFLSGAGTGICIGTRFGPAVIERSIITRHSWEINIEEPAMVDHLEFVVTGGAGWLA